MRDFLNRVILSFARLARIEGEVRIIFNKRNALVELGWFRSFRMKKPVDASGRPVPWITYPAAAFIEGRLSKLQSVFEYGSGGSTIWLAARCKAVYSVEHDAAWYAEIVDKLPGDCFPRLIPVAPHQSYLDIAFSDLKSFSSYTNAIADTPLADVAVIDGVYRNSCIVKAAQHISPSGVIIYDNTDFPEARLGVDFLLENGWKRLVFVGMTPGLDKLSETSVFYRLGNCWRI